MEMGLSDMQRSSQVFKTNHPYRRLVLPTKKNEWKSSLEKPSVESVKLCKTIVS